MLLEPWWSESTSWLSVASKMVFHHMDVSLAGFEPASPRIVWMMEIRHNVMI